MRSQWGIFERNEIMEKKYDVVVVGGGMSGVCAAVSSARNGAKTALIQNRPVLGGNASSEIRVSINGAGRHEGFRNAMESGVILELLLRNKRVNPQCSFSVMDSVTWEMVSEEKNIDLYLNTHMIEAETREERITRIKAIQITTNKEYEFLADMFIDTTGDANLAYLSGADYTIGREGKDVYGESLAPEHSDSCTMGSTILFQAKHTGKATTFHRPKFAYEFTEKMIGGREIHEVEDGYWWIEVGGDDLKIIEDAESIRDELLKYVYGIFDYIKNSGKFPEAWDLVLDWIAPIPGKRESRRILGDYVLNQNDCYEGKRFEDAVAYGGWTMDNHTCGGIRAVNVDDNEEGTKWNVIKDIYTIPYRCLYSRNIKNLLVGGRAISASHMAISSTRVIATCSVIGQAIGTAAALAVKYHLKSAREVNNYIDELQQTLIRDDAYLPGIKNRDQQELVRRLQPVITASSNVSGGEATNINGDYSRKIGEKEYAWISDTMSEQGEWIQIQFLEKVSVKNICLRFDPNFSRLLTPTIALVHQKLMVENMPYELVKAYEIQFLNNGDIIFSKSMKDNYLRVNEHEFAEGINCDCVRVLVKETHGDLHARIFEIGIYD